MDQPSGTTPEAAPAPAPDVPVRAPKARAPAPDVPVRAAEAPAPAADAPAPAADAATGTAEDSQPSQPTDAGRDAGSPGFRARGRVRRRVRFLRKARELAYRDLGGLVFNLHRFDQRNDALVAAKLSALTSVDSELRALEATLGEHQPMTVLHEAGVTACPRCAATHSGEDRFCPSCGLPMSRHVDLPIASAPASPTPASPPATDASGSAATPASAGSAAAPTSPAPGGS